MDRAYESGAISSAPPPPSPPLLGYPTETGTPTVPGAWWFYMIAEELRALIVGAGITPSATVVTQVLAAVEALIAAGNVATATLAAQLSLTGLSTNSAFDLALVTSATTLGYPLASNGSFNPATGALTVSGVISAASVNVTSDVELKSNRRPLEEAGAKLDRLDFELYELGEDAVTHIGIPAQQMKQVQPEIVHPVQRKVVADDGTVRFEFSHLSVNLYGAVSLIGAATKETRAQVREQADIIQSLLGRIQTLESRLSLGGHP